MCSPSFPQTSSQFLFCHSFQVSSNTLFDSYIAATVSLWCLQLWADRCSRIKARSPDVAASWGSVDDSTAGPVSAVQRLLEDASSCEFIPAHHTVVTVPLTAETVSWGGGVVAINSEHKPICVFALETWGNYLTLPVLREFTSKLEQRLKTEGWCHLLQDLNTVVSPAGLQRVWRRRMWVSPDLRSLLVRILSR